VVCMNVRTTARQVSTNCQIYQIKSVLYAEVNEVENLLVTFDSFVWSEDCTIKLSFSQANDNLN
jgi:hypothetical protein